METTSVATDLARTAPLAGSAVYLNFVSTYGAALVVTLSVIYGVMQIVLRILEHRKIMRMNTK